MKWFILLVGIVVLCFVVALMLGLGGGMGRPTSSLSHEPLPEGDLHDEDLAELRFDVTARGYRMSQVDGVGPAPSGAAREGRADRLPPIRVGAYPDEANADEPRLRRAPLRRRPLRRRSLRASPL